MLKTLAILNVMTLKLWRKSHISTLLFLRFGNRFLNHMPEHVFSLAKPRLNRPLAKKKATMCFSTYWWQIRKNKP